MAYKQDIDDYRESPAIPVIDLLKENGAAVEFYDPYIKSYKENGMVVTGLDSIDGNVVASYDLVMVTCGHTNVDYNMIQQNAAAIFDTRNAMQHIENRENIEVL